MFCSGCGHELQADRHPARNAAGRPPPLTPPALPSPGFEFELTRYAGKIRVLGILWLVLGGLSLLTGFAALHFRTPSSPAILAPGHKTTTCSPIGSGPR